MPNASFVEMKSHWRKFSTTHTKKFWAFGLFFDFKSKRFGLHCGPWLLTWG